jgi:hypothetical protein
LVESIETLEGNQIPSNPLQKSTSDFDSDSDDEIAGQILYRPRDGSDSDYSNREIDYDDDEDEEDFDEEYYDPYEPPLS